VSKPDKQGSTYIIPVDQEQAKRQMRKARMENRKNNKPKTPTLNDIYDLLLDIAGEIEDFKSQ